MKNYLLIISLLLLQTSCQDVIELDLNTAEPKLVIEASINWIKGTNGNDQAIKLSLTAPYFDKNIPPATGASVNISDDNGNTFVFIEDGESGIYRTDTFLPMLEASYQLTIIYKMETYIGKESLKAVVAINEVEQNNDAGFLGNDIELKAYYTDPVYEKNFNLFEFKPSPPLRASLSIYEDRYNNGNRIFGYYSDKDLVAGNEVVIRNYGISEQFYNFMFILLQQNNSSGGGPFELQPAVVRGNCINQTNLENYPLGYFRLSEVSEVIYSIQ